MIPRLLAALLLILPVTRAARADDGDSEFDFQFSGSTTTLIELNDIEDSDEEPDDYTKVKQLFSLNLEWSDFAAGVQVEYLDYSHLNRVDNLVLDRLHDTWELRKYYLDYSTERVEARLGTFFTSFGRGLTLYVQKNDALGLDEPVHGATVTATLGRFDLTAVGGEVTEPQLEIQHDRRFEDQLWGGRVLARLPGNFYLGGSAVGARLETFTFGSGEDDVDVWSLEGGGLGVAGIFDIDAEWAEIERTVGSVKDGYGRYLSVTSYVGPLRILAEYKDYWNFDYRYNEPPNAGRDIEAYEHKDVKGGRLLVDGDIAATGTLIYASYGRFDTHKETTSLGGADGDGQVEWYVGLEETAGPVYLETSYFKRRFADREIDEEHTLADLHYTVGERGEVILTYDGRVEKASYFRLGIHRSGLAYSLAPYGTLSVRYSWEESSLVGDEDFWGAELEVNPTRAMTLTLFAGSDPGGLVCSGGQCREEPPFDGFKMRFTWRF